jgi:hypothetical protein
LVQRGGGQQGLQFLEEGWLGHVVFVQIAKTAGLQVTRPVQCRRQRLQLRAIHLVEELVRVALLHARQRGLRQRRFDAHDG